MPRPLRSTFVSPFRVRPRRRRFVERTHSILLFVPGLRKLSQLERFTPVPLHFSVLLSPVFVFTLALCLFFVFCFLTLATESTLFRRNELGYTKLRFSELSAHYPLPEASFRTLAPRQHCLALTPIKGYGRTLFQNPNEKVGEMKFGERVLS